MGKVRGAQNYGFTAQGQGGLGNDFARFKRGFLRRQTEPHKAGLRKKETYHGEQNLYGIVMVRVILVGKTLLQ
ncbi:hypothetical protein FACS189485_20190 [Spirochaetia bacterium]|nr:hypothetical protein FACS189485_20190 [Spirochaetia bacterium]